MWPGGNAHWVLLQLWQFCFQSYCNLLLLSFAGCKQLNKTTPFSDRFTYIFKSVPIMILFRFDMPRANEMTNHVSGSQNNI